MGFHLNASDDRGVDIVRGPINQFVVREYVQQRH